MLATVHVEHLSKDALPVCLHGENINGLAGPRRLWSLLDVLQIYAPEYVRIGQMYQDYLHGLPSLISDPNVRPTQAQYESLLTTLRDLRQECQDTHLLVSARTMDRTIQEFEKIVPTLRMSQDRIAA